MERLVLIRALGQSPKGTTLVELTVASMLLLLLLGASYQVFHYSARYFHRISTRSDMQRNAITTLSHLHRELQETNAFSVALPNQETVIFLAPRSMDGTHTTALDGAPLWSSAVCIRYQADGDGGQILRQQDPILPQPDAVAPATLVPSRDLDYFLSSSTTHNRILGQHVSRFEVRKAGQVDNGLSFVLEFRRRPDNRDFRLEVSTTIQPKN